MKLKRATMYLLPVFTFTLGLLCYSAIDNNYFDLNQDNSISETRQPGKYKLINPLLECDAYNFEQDRNLGPLKQQISDLIDRLKSDNLVSFASVYYRDLNNGPWIGINQSELFSPSSLIKVPTMMTYFRLAQSNPDILNQVLTYNPASPAETQNFAPAVTLEAGKSYTVNELIRRMIVYSDNEAYNLLNNNIDSSQIIQTYNDLGIDISKGLTDPTGDIISVTSYASFFRILYNSSYLSKDMSERALDLLSQVKFNQGLVAGVNDPAITIAHKFGERDYLSTGEKQLHDCGIIYLPRKPYLLCIMTRGNDFNNLTSAISQISSLIHTTVKPKD